MKVNIRVSQLCLLACAIALACGFVFVAAPAQAQTGVTMTWTLSTPTTGVVNSMTGTLGGSKGTCTGVSPGSLGNGDVNVCPGDTITWSISGAPASYRIIVFTQKEILSGSSPDMKVSFSGPASVTLMAYPPLPGQNMTVEYYIAITDGSGNVWALDPKILVGSGN